MPVTSIYFTIEDKKGDASTVSIPIGAAVSPVNAVAAVKSFAPLVGALINGRLKTAGVSMEVSVTGFPATADVNSDVQEKGLFSFRGVNGFIKNLSLPAIKESIFSLGSKDIDQANSDVAAFLTAMTDGVDLTANGGDTTLGASDVRGDDLTEVVEAREAWGKYRRS